MPETWNQAPSRHRRANLVGLRTLRQLPKAVGATAGGEPIYDVRSVRLLLDGMAPNFVRLAECSRCGREFAGAPVLTTADLERPLRAIICDDCIPSAGVSTVSESEGTEPAGERPAPSAPAVPGTEPVPAPAEVKPERLDVMEGHLRAVIDRVNELGRVARAHQADIKEQARWEEETAAALRDDLAALRAATGDTRAELQNLARAQAERQGLARAQAERQSPPVERPPGESGDGAGAGQLREEVAQLARLVEAQRQEVVGFVAAVGETAAATSKLAGAHDELAGTIARFDLSTVEDLIANRLAEAEGRLAQAVARPAPEVDLSKVEELIAARLSEAEGRLTRLIAGHRADLATAIEGSVNGSMAGAARANEALAGQMAQAFRRMEILLDRLDVLEAAVFQPPSAPAPFHPAPAAAAGAGNFLDGLDRQLEAAARRLAARSRAGAGGTER